MDARDLRIGNFVFYKCSFFINEEKTSIFEVDGECISYIENNKNYIYNPIELNEKWIYELAGNCIIEKIKENIFVVDSFRLIWSKKCKHWGVFYDVVPVYITAVRYVHQWQNLFFAITDMELIMKKEKK